MTAQEVAAFGAAAIGHASTGPLRRLAAAVDQVGFDRGPPHDLSAETAWEDCDVVVSLVARSVSRVELMRFRLQPRSLVAVLRS
jgi:hypothetical protein